ncbi:MAG: glycosyltransferase [Muribaculaceae bacterium]|nr:glycosyltransferase [Muribaculaceae bacterium]
MHTAKHRDPQLVSIITPAYNCGRFIGETIRTVLAQTYPHWEMIIVDDASADDTAEVVRSFDDPRIRYSRLEKNMGSAEGRNAAIRMARGRWIAFLDSDDLWDPRKLERQLDFMKRNDYSFSYTEYSQIDCDGKDLGIRVSGPKHVSSRGMKAYNWLGCLTVMYDADKIGLVQGPVIRKRNDYGLWLVVSRKADCYLLPENLASYRVRSGSLSHQSYVSLIKWHYELLSILGHNPVMATLHTGANLIFGIYKKLVYHRKV